LVLSKLTNQIGALKKTVERKTEKLNLKINKLYCKSNTQQFLAIPKTIQDAKNQKFLARAPICAPTLTN
jgi:hypothetical protein